MEDPDVIRIFDTTLRDGEQSPGATMTTEEKIQVAEQLVRLNVDIIEAGFPAASPGDLIAVKEIARRTRGVAVAGLARANTGDIDAAWEGIREADRPVIHVFIATSDIHLKHKLKLNKEEALHQVKRMVAYARNLSPTVEFSAEDATRSEWDYLSVSVKQRSGLALQPSIFPIPWATPCRMNTRRFSVTCANASQVSMM